MMTPTAVAPRVRVGEDDKSLTGSSSSVANAFARPKSRILTRPSGVILIFAGFKVTMHNTRRVRRFERFRDLLEDRNGLFDRERTTGEPLLKRVAMYELHYQVRDGAFCLQPVERRDARVIQ